jgi:hypothetical protein
VLLLVKVDLRSQQKLQIVAIVSVFAGKLAEPELPLWRFAAKVLHPGLWIAEKQVQNVEKLVQRLKKLVGISN